MSEPLHHGVVKSFNHKKGWGHIECPETFERWGKDVFLLRAQLRGSSRVSKGDRVSFRVTDKGRGPEAVDCKLENLEVDGVAVREERVDARVGLVVGRDAKVGDVALLDVVEDHR